MSKNPAWLNTNSMHILLFVWFISLRLTAQCFIRKKEGLILYLFQSLCRDVFTEVLLCLVAWTKYQTSVRDTASVNVYQPSNLWPGVSGTLAKHVLMEKSRTTEDHVERHIQNDLLLVYTALSVDVFWPDSKTKRTWFMLGRALICTSFHGSPSSNCCANPLRRRRVSGAPRSVL